MVTTAEAKPFEEVIAQEILGVRSKDQLLVFAGILQKAEIKANHAVIREAFRRMAQVVGLASNAHTYHMVLLALWNQEQRAMREQVAV